MPRQFLTAIVVTLFLVGLCDTVCLQTVKSQNKSKIKIGLVLSTSGAAQPYGENAKRGVELAADEINASGGINGQQIEIVFRDCKTDGKEAARVLNELIDDEKVQVVIGDVTSTCVVEMEPIANERKVTLITPGASYPELSRKGDFVFRYWYSDELEGKADARYAKLNLNWTNLATAYIDIPYGRGINAVFVREFEKLGGRVSKEISFTQGQRDFRTQLHLLSSQERLDGVFLASYRNESVAFLRQLRAISNQDISSIRILSTQPFNNLDIVKGASGAAENVIFSVPRPPLPSNKAAERFRQAYKEIDIEILGTSFQCYQL
jgi:branched-chain amino acid transport system substrate-binding protein